MINKNYIALLHKIGLNHNKLHLISNEYDDFKLFYDNLSSDLLYSYGFSPKQIKYILAEKEKIDIDYIDLKLKEREVDIILFFDSKYPKLLKNINNPPFILYLRGKIDNGPKISIVGTRMMSSYGKKIISNIVGDISRYFTIVSGGAAGCDTEAHKVSLLNEGKTISVIGTGIDIDYPVSNRRLYDDIVNNGGGIISIFPLGEVGNAYNFPVRNEIVAGLSLGTVVIEAKIKSGTLITANLALDLGKDLFAVPGDIFLKNSEGCNLLISKGNAKSISGSKELLEEYNILGPLNINKDKSKIEFNDDIDKNIYNILMIENLTINELKNKINIDITTLSFKLSMMEINKYIKKGLGGKYEVF